MIFLLTDEYGQGIRRYIIVLTTLIYWYTDRKAKAQRLKFSDGENDTTANDSEAACEVNQNHTCEEDELITNDNNMGGLLEGFTEPNTDNEVDELMAGICPEDLSFNTSYAGMTTPVKNVDTAPQPLGHSTGMTTPVKNVDTAPQPLGHSTPNKIPGDSNNVTASSSVTEQDRRITGTTPVSKISKSVVAKVNKVLGVDFQGFKLSSEIKNTSLKQCDKLRVYPEGTFYGLSEDVLNCLEEVKGIKRLYGENDNCC